MQRQIKKTSSIVLSSQLRNTLSKFSTISMILLSLSLIFLSQKDKINFQEININVIDKITPVITFISKPIETINMLSTKISDLYYAFNDNKLLRQEISIARQKLIDYDKIIGENTRLKELLNYVDKQDIRYISGMVLLNSNSPYNKNLVINVGENQGVLKGKAVINHNGLIGRIIASANNSSRVMLLTDINSRIPVISTISRQKAILAGNNDLLPSLIYIQNSTKLIDGETLITSGDGSQIPYGIPVGVINTQNNNFNVIPITSETESDFISVVEH